MRSIVASGIKTIAKRRFNYLSVKFLDILVNCSPFKLSLLVVLKGSVGIKLKLDGLPAEQAVALVVALVGPSLDNSHTQIMGDFLRHTP